MENKKQSVRTLFLTFLKIGAFTFGGGYAMIPLIEREVCETHHYIKKEELVDIVAISESTPGPIAINSATFIGYRTAGMAGAFSATAGVVLPSFLTIFVISWFLTQFESFRAVRYAFYGIRVSVVVLIFNALCMIWKQSPRGTMPYILMAAAFIAVTFLNVSAILVIAAGLVIGIASVMAGRNIKKAGETK